MVNVYGAVIMAVIARVHPVHLMNVVQRQAAADPSSDLGCESACLHPHHRLLLLNPKADTHMSLWLCTHFFDLI